MKRKVELDRMARGLRRVARPALTALALAHFRRLRGAIRFTSVAPSRVRAPRRPQRVGRNRVGRNRVGRNRVGGNRDGTPMANADGCGHAVPCSDRPWGFGLDRHSLDGWSDVQRPAGARQHDRRPR